MELRDHDNVLVAKLDDGSTVSASYPANGAATNALVEMGNEAGAIVEIDKQDLKDSVQTVTTFLLPLMILANLFALLFIAARAGGGALGDVEDFGTLDGGKGRAASTRSPSATSPAPRRP